MSRRFTATKKIRLFKHALERRFYQCDVLKCSQKAVYLVPWRAEDIRSLVLCPHHMNKLKEAFPTVLFSSIINNSELSIAALNISLHISVYRRGLPFTVKTVMSQYKKLIGKKNGKNCCNRGS